METYNHLITQFHDSQTPSNNVLQLKSLADQLFKVRSSKKMHCLLKKNELQALQQQKQTTLSLSRISGTMRSSSLSSFSTSKQDFVEVDRQALKKKKEELQKQISVLREKNQSLASQLTLFQKKQAEIHNVNAKSQLEVFNAVQALYIEASRQNEQEVKEQQLLKQLKSRRQNVAYEIENLIRDRQANDKVVKRWSQIKEINANPVKNDSEDVSWLKKMLSTMLNLNEMIINHQQMDLSSDTNCKDFLGQMDNLNSKIQITSLLKKIPLKMDDKFAQKVIAYHQLLENQFDRNERANKQINQHLQALHNKHMELAEILQKAHLQKQKLAKEHLQKTQFSLKELEECFNAKCRLITNFATKFYIILKRMQSLRNTVNEILNSAKDLKLRLKCCEDSNNSVIFSYDQQLNKNPEDILVRWYQSLSSNSQFYHRYIENNDLLRILSCPQSYNFILDDLTNYQMFMVSCFRSVLDFTKKMAKEIDAFFKYCRCYQDKIASEDNVSQSEGNQFCVESMDYYRRDNYKLLQKLKQNQLRKKGLLIQIPFNVNLQNQLIPRDQQKQEYEFQPLISPKTTERNRKYMKYTDLASKRQERSMKNSVVRKLFDQLNSFRSQSSCRFKTLNSLKESRLTVNHTKDYQRKTIKRISMPRNTVGTVQKENSQRY